MTEKEIIKLIEEKREEIRDIEQIPEDLNASEKVIFVEARRELSLALGHFIDLIKGKKSAETKPQKHELLP